MSPGQRRQVWVAAASNFDTSAFPDLLMEPFNTNVDVNDGDVDLTDELLAGIEQCSLIPFSFSDTFPAISRKG